MPKRKKTSEAWVFFTEDPATSTATCNLCATGVKRGKDGDKSSWSATPLWAHLKRHHPVEHAEAEKQRTLEAATAKKKKESENERQQLYVHGTPTLATFLTKKQKYLPDSPDQKESNKLLGDWIADGVLPYAIVDNPK